MVNDPKSVLAHMDLKWQNSIEPTAVLALGDLKGVAEQLKSDGWILLDVVGVDYLNFVNPQPERFAVIYNCYHLQKNARVFLKVFVDEKESVPSLYPVWRSSNYLEREVYDLVGVVFEGHPNLRKILTPEDLEGHPLRKDFPIGETPTLFNDGRFLDPGAFRAGLTGNSSGLTGWCGGERAGTSKAPLLPTEKGFVANVTKGVSK